ncbi:P-loop NTPase [Candidatus Deianiraea vastatrix]|uniref:Iron-sulfur cluster carrier protein n=1 Tax=Candidatus Deianiraea vastatrix TaxID=2163644 RepID=A0A5B8XEN5_9RICK|nr:P-loop NTPase [Candidatus Deianiraea vastatrix]QED23426.1 Putative antiporter/iron-sulfur cluster carrier protein [Candidatus Deianiraea vastatrix]
MQRYLLVFEKIYLPFSSLNLAHSNIVTSVLVKNDTVYITLDGNCSAEPADLYFIKRKIECGISEIYGQKAICIIESKDPKVNAFNMRESSDISGMFTKISGVKNTICVISGKGGVGKSTIAIKHALKLQKDGFKVGICDLDIYGPSIPKMLDISGKCEFENGKIKPFVKNELQIASIGFMIEEKDPIIWRGPMINKAISQLLREVAWRDLDYLIIDTPPGTGDVHISLIQKAPLDRVICVTTNDAVAIQNTTKCVNMFRKMGILVQKLVTNMAYSVKNDEKIYLFGQKDAAKNTMSDLGFLEFEEVEFLA